MAEFEISYTDLFSPHVDRILHIFEEQVDINVEKGVEIDFDISGRLRKHKVSPIVRKATPSDAEEIVEIYRTVYAGTYPYKEMEDPEEVAFMLTSDNYEWFLYLDPNQEVAGCITFVLDFAQKRGYIRGFMLKPRFQGKIDITKAMIISMLCMSKMYRDIIYVWYVENRTAHAKSQYSMSICGISPIAFYPNKDVFMGKVESDLMQITYDSRIFRQFRSEQIPTFIPEVFSCFHYTSLMYQIQKHRIIPGNVAIDEQKKAKLKEKVSSTITRDDFGYETIVITIDGAESFFSFLYTPQVGNFEKINFRTENKEELAVFLEILEDYIKIYDVRYVEVFVSAYKWKEQKLFLEYGFLPRGYIPCWDYNPDSDRFRDGILFSKFKGEIADDIQLIDTAKMLLSYLDLNANL